MKIRIKLLPVLMAAALAFAGTACQSDNTDGSAESGIVQNGEGNSSPGIGDTPEGFETLNDIREIPPGAGTTPASEEFVDNKWAAFLVSPSLPAYDTAEKGNAILTVLSSDSVIGSVALASLNAPAPAPTTAYGADVITAGGPVAEASLAHGRLSEVADSFLNALSADMKGAIGLEYGEHDGGAGMGYRTFYQASYDVTTGGLQVNQENGYWARTLGAYSEHCAGLAVDFNISYNSSEFIESTGSVNREGTAPANKEFTWLADNAHKYGFIWRYKIDGDTTSATGQRTGTIYEGWHWRFVGVYNATKFWEKCAADTDGDGILDKGYMTNDNYVWEDYYNEYIANDPSYPHSEYEAFTSFYNSEAGNKCTHEEYIFR